MSPSCSVQCLFWTGVLLSIADVSLAPWRGRQAAAQEAKPLPRVKDFSLLDPAGRRHTLAEWRGRKAVVLVFLGIECPVSNGYAPELTRLVKAYRGRNVAFYGVHPDPEVTAAVATKHAADYGLPFPLLLDPHQVLARQVGVTRVPEALVVHATGDVVYRGRIDDRYALNGRRREEPKSRDLEMAIEAVLAGRRPNPAVTEVFGCPLPSPSREGKP